MYLPIDPRVALVVVICIILNILLSIFLLLSGFLDITQILFFILIILACPIRRAYQTAFQRRLHSQDNFR